MKNIVTADARMLRIHAFTEEIKRLMYHRALDRGYTKFARIDDYTSGLFNFLFAHSNEWTFLHLLKMLNDDGFLDGAWEEMLR